jgi:hypothetical protein
MKFGDIFKRLDDRGFNNADVFKAICQKLETTGFTVKYYHQTQHQDFVVYEKSSWKVEMYSPHQFEGRDVAYVVVSLKGFCSPPTTVFQSNEIESIATCVKNSYVDVQARIFAASTMPRGAAMVPSRAMGLVVQMSRMGIQSDEPEDVVGMKKPTAEKLALEWQALFGTPWSYKSFMGKPTHLP